MLIALQVAGGAAVAAPPGNPVAGRCSAVYPGALRLRNQADNAISHRDYAGASRLLDKGLALLGTAYIDPRALDDSGMHLAFARHHDNKRQFARAAASKRTVLTERLASCLRGAGTLAR